MPVIVATQTLPTHIFRYFLGKGYYSQGRATSPTFEEDITVFLDMEAKGTAGGD